MNATLLGKRAFAEVIVKDLKMRSSWIIQVDPKPNAGILVRDREGDTQRGRPCKNGGRDGNDVIINQGSQTMLTGSRRWKRQGGIVPSGLQNCG